VTAPNPAAGKPVEQTSLQNIPRLVTAYFASKPDRRSRAARCFRHLGPSWLVAENFSTKIISSRPRRRICDHRRETGLKVTLHRHRYHALAEPALASAVEVFAANRRRDHDRRSRRYTPTPVISHAILSYNRGRTSALRRSRDHALAQSAGGWRLQYNPHAWRPRPIPMFTATVEKQANAYMTAGLKASAESV